MMDYQLLGSTGVTVSAMGVGAGGPSQLGLRGGGDEDNAVRVIREAIDLGVNFIDTAEAYRTEAAVGKAIQGIRREEIVLSTKISHWENLDADGVVASVEDRLRLLGTDYLDICHFHAVENDKYDHVAERLRPGLERAREQGKVRLLGVTEMFNAEPGHEMLSRATESGIWDVVMVGYNVMNQSALDRVFPHTLRHGTGVLDMFAVRLALSRAERLAEVMGELIASGKVTNEAIEEAGGTPEDPLGWVVRESDAETLVEAAYRFVRHEEAIHVTLSGTGNVLHMRENVETMQKPPLDQKVVEKLKKLFAGVDSVTAQ
jgi:aryl-alcohol dehydrogenase-like predicted oxidoreductase